MVLAGIMWRWPCEVFAPRTTDIMCGDQLTIVWDTIPATGNSIKPQLVYYVSYSHVVIPTYVRQSLDPVRHMFLSKIS